MAGYEVGSAYLSILPSTKNFASLLGNELSGPFSSVGSSGGATLGSAIGTGGRSSFSSAGTALGAVFVGAFAAIGASQMVDAVVTFMGDAVSAASDLSETQNKVNEIFGDGADILFEYAETAAQTLGQSQQTFLDGASTFGIFGQSAGLAGEDLAGFATEMVTLATDLASFNNTSPEDAIQAIGAALRGEAEPIRRYGVLLDDATLRQRAFALGLTTTTTEALTPQQRVLAAHAEILAQTATQQGDFARTSDGLANSQRIATASMADFQAKIGETLLPVISEFFGVFVEVGMPILSTFTTWMTENPEIIRGFVTTIGVAALTVIDAFLAMGENMASFGTFFVTLLQGLTNSFLTFVGYFLDGAASAFGWIPGVGEDLTDAKTEFDAFQTSVDENFTQMSEVTDLWTNTLSLSRTAVDLLRESLRNLDGTSATVTINTEWRNPPPESLNTAAAIYSASGGMRARGGPVVAGTPYIVGEESWELFVPDTNGTILNPAQVAAALGGSGGRGGDTFYITEQRDPAGTAYEVQRRQWMREA